MEALFGRAKVFVERWDLYWAPRLRGTAALQVRNGYRSLDLDLAGVRSSAQPDHHTARKAIEELLSFLATKQVEVKLISDIVNGFCSADAVARFI